MTHKEQWALQALKGDWPINIEQERYRRETEGVALANSLYEEGFVMYNEAFYSEKYLRRQELADWQHVPEVLRYFAGLLWKSLKQDGIPVWVSSAFEKDAQYGDPHRWGNAITFQHHKHDKLRHDSQRLILLRAKGIYDQIPHKYGDILPTGRRPLEFQWAENERYEPVEPPVAMQPERRTLGSLLTGAKG